MSKSTDKKEKREREKKERQLQSVMHYMQMQNGQYIWKFQQKFENIFKKGRWLCAIIAFNKLLGNAV